MINPFIKLVKLLNGKHYVKDDKIIVEIPLEEFYNYVLLCEEISRVKGK